MNEEELPVVEGTRLLHHAPHDGTSAAAAPVHDEFSSTPVITYQSWVRVALIFVTGALSLPSFVAGVDVSAAQPSLATAITAILCGNGILALIASVTGIIGSRTRRNSYGLARIAFGQYGAAVFNGIFCISLLGWFGVNLNLFSQCIVRVHGHDILLLKKIVELGGGIVMTLTTMYGIRALELLSLLLAPVLAIVTVLLITKAYTTLTNESFGEQSDNEADVVSLSSLNNVVVDGRAARSDMGFGQAISSVVGLCIVGAIIAPDYTRFIRESRGAAYSAFVAFAITASVVEFAGGIASVAFQNDNLFDILAGIGWKWESFGVIIASSWILNVMNLYSASLSFKATVSTRVENRICVGVLGFLGTIAAFTNLLDSFLSFLFYLSVAFAPIAAVIAVDYAFLRRSVYDANGDSVLESPVFRPVSLLAWTLGVACAVLGTFNVMSVTGIAVLDAVMISAVSYYAISHLRQ